MNHRAWQWLLVMIVALAAHHRTDARADDFPTPVNTEPDGAAPVMSADQAAATMKVPAGFSVGVFAGEPDVQNPIDMAWDSAGRLWVAENYTYSDRSERFDLSLRDRVLMFTDDDGDGVSDSRTVFTDNVQMLTSVEVGLGGVWLMCPPKLLFIPDADADGVPDGPAEVVLDGFEVAKANYHNFANGLRFGPDGWLYGRCGGSCPGRIGTPGTPDEQRVRLEGGIWRYDPVTKFAEVLTAGTTNPWGHDWNENGDLFFINTVNGHLWHGIPGAHFTRPFTLDPNRRTYDLIDFHADHWHFDTTGSWTASRDGAANDFGGGHAHCGTMIYRGGVWPEKYQGKLFTLNFHGRRANVEDLQREGAGYVGRHEDDFFIAEDPWFRGMELMVGPDGHVVVLDWSDTGECHEHTGVHRQSGRIFKIRYDNADPAAAGQDVVDLRKLSDADLAGLHSHDNDWFVRQARLELGRRRFAGSLDTASLEPLRATMRSDRVDQAVSAMMTLHALDQLTPDDRRKLLSHPSDVMRSLAVRQIADRWPIDDVMGPWFASAADKDRVTAEASKWMPQWKRLATSDPSAKVRLSLASVLQRLPVAMRCDLAAPLSSHGQDADDHDLPLMIWYGLYPVADESPSDLAVVFDHCELPVVRRNIARRLAEEIDGDRRPLEILISSTTESRDGARAIDLIDGIASALQGVRRADPPRGWDEFASIAGGAVKGRSDSGRSVQALRVIFGDGQAIDAIKRIALDDSADPAARHAAIETLIRSRPDDLFEVCEKLLKSPLTNVVAAKGLSTFDDPGVARMILKQYNRFRAPRRPEVLSLLVSRGSFAGELIDAIEAGDLPREDLTAVQVQQIHSLDDPKLSARISEVWGEVRTTSADKRQQIETLKLALTPDSLRGADLSHGRSLYEKNCGQCHLMFGSGGKVGPDLTGANRSNLDYLLDNIVDPSAVVDKDFRMTVVLVADGRVISGLVLDRNAQSWTIQTATDKIVVADEDVEESKVTEKSPMPDGVLDSMTDDQRRDLIAYLMSPTQVPVPK